MGEQQKPMAPCDTTQDVVAEFPEEFGEFVLLRRVGEGGMGEVFEAQHRGSADSVALKKLTLTGRGVASQQLIKMFKDEFRSLSELSHPNLIRLFELFTDTSDPFFTMELIDGNHFLDHVRAGFDSNIPNKETLPYDPRILNDALRQAVDGISALHKAKKLHRDIKSSNVLVTRDEGRVVLVDFGLAVDLDPEHSVFLNSRGNRAGTLPYMAPEQHEGRQLGKASDWYSLGVMLFEALTGEKPYSLEGSGQRVGMDRADQYFLTQKLSDDRPVPADRVPQVSSELSGLCYELLDPDPAKRPRGEDILARIGTPPQVIPSHYVFIGRARQLKTLESALGDVAKRRPTTVFVSGQPGAGKSALVDRFLTTVRGRSRYVILRGRCYENESVPYKGFDMIVDSLATYLSHEPIPRVEAITPKRGSAALCRVFPSLQTVPTIRHFASKDPEAEHERNPQEWRYHGMIALWELLDQLTYYEELIIHIDDVQWGDVDTAALLQRLFLEKPIRCLMIAAFREVAGGKPSSCVQTIQKFNASHPHGQSRRHYDIEIGKLDFDDAKQLAAELIAVESSDVSEHAAHIAREAGGNPLFVKILAQELSKSNQTVSASRHQSLEDVYWNRIRELPTEQRSFVELVVVAGRPVPVGLIRQAVGSNPYPALLLENLRRLRLIQQVAANEGMVVEPYHDRVRETVSARIGEDRLRNRAGSLANAVLATPTDYDPEFIARLLDRSGRQRDASYYHRKAAEQAADQLAFPLAIKHYQDALDGAVDDDVKRELLEGRAKALACDGKGKEAALELEQAAKYADGDHQLDLRRQSALRYLTSGHIDRGMEAMREVLREVGMPLPRSRFQAVMNWVWWRIKLNTRRLRFRILDTKLPKDRQRPLDYSWAAAEGLNVVDPVVAATYVTRNLLLAFDAGVPFYLTRAIAAQVCHLAATGQSSRQAVARFLGVLRRAATPEDDGRPCGCARDTYSRACRELARGVAAHLQGRWRAAHRCCDRAASYFLDKQNQDVAWELDTSRTFAMWALMYEGRINELTKRQPDLFRRAKENNDVFAELNFGSVVMANVLLADDQPSEVRRRLEAEENLLSKKGFFVQHHNWLLARTLLELYEGRPAAAWDVISASRGDYRRSLLDWVEQVRVDFLQVQGRAAVAVAACKDAGVGPRPATAIVRELRRGKAAWANAIAELLDAGLASIDGDKRRAINGFRKAAADLESVDMYLHAAGAHCRLGELMGDDGAEHRSRGLKLMEGLGVVNPQRMTTVMAPGRFDDLVKSANNSRGD